MTDCINTIEKSNSSNNIFGKYVKSDLEIDKIIEYVDISSKSGKEFLINLFETPLFNIDELKGRQFKPLLFKYLSNKQPDIINNLQNSLSKYKENETFFQEMNENINNSDNEENIKQVLWNSETPFGRIANESTSILEAFHNWRTLFIPASTLVAPILAVLVPFAILQLMDKKPNIQEYLTIIQKTVKNSINIPSLFRSKHENDRFGFLLESMYVGMTIAFFMSGMYNTIMNAMHLRTIANKLKNHSNKILNLHQCLKDLHNVYEKIDSLLLNSKYSLTKETKPLIEELKILENKSGLGLFGTYYNNKTILNNLYTYFGQIDVYFTLSQLQNTSFVYFINNSDKPYLSLKDVYHPLLKDPVKNHYYSNNCLLTGPNRGGKSTYLKSVCLSVFLAQTIGIVFASYCKLTPFTLFQTALSPVDCLGRYSLFESEIEFAKSILYSQNQPTFIVMDEIFHSTNANDGYEASKLFLDQLYKKEHILSIVSTHYTDLTSDFKHCTKALQAQCEKNEDNSIKYTYKITEGVNKISSVLEILKEHGLIASN